MENKELIEVEIQERNVAIREKSFALSQRELAPFASTAMIPAHLRDIGSLMILDNVSRKYKMDLLFLAQEMYIVKGKFSISGKLAIALINKSGILDENLRWEVRENPFGVRAYGKINGEDRKGMWVDDNLIRSNSWERNPLWKSQKELMARYRSATYFARMEMPEVLMGFHTDDEVQDMTFNEKDQIAESSINKEVTNEPEEVLDAVVDNESSEERTGLNDAVEVQEIEEEAKEFTEVVHKRAVKAVSSRYGEMEQAGFRRGHLAQVVKYYDLTADNIDKFMEGISTYHDEFYTSHQNLNPAENKEEPYTVDSEVAAEFGTMVIEGLAREDLTDFCRYYKLTGNNIESFLTQLEEKINLFYKDKA